MKFKSSDERYLTQRRNFSEQSGPRELWPVIDLLASICRYWQFI